MSKGHNWDPKEYNKHSDQQQVWARELISKLNLSGSEHVLDVGCGDGKVTVEIAAQVPRGKVVGMDMSDQMVEFARQSFPPAKHPNLSFVQGDAADFDLGTEFDLVFSNAVLHWLKDHGPVLLSISRALKPQGWALLQMGGKGNAEKIIGVMEYLAERDPWQAYLAGMGMPYGFHGPEEYQAWLEPAGLKARRLELIPKTMVFAGKEGLKGWIRSTWLPYTSRVPDEMREDLIEEVAQAYLKDNPADEKDQVRVGMVRLEAELVKPA